MIYSGQSSRGPADSRLHTQKVSPAGHTESRKILEDTSLSGTYVRDPRTGQILQATIELVMEPYSAATAPVSTGSTRTAAYLNSGILPYGSTAGFVRMFAAAST